MADTLIKWKQGKSGLYSARVISKDDWEGLGFTGDDTKEVRFDRSNNFTVVGDGMPFAQFDYFEDDPEFEVKQNSETTEVKPTRSGSITTAALTGVPSKTVDVAPADTATSTSDSASAK